VHPYLAPGNDLPPEAPNGNATDAYPATFDASGNCTKNCDWPGDGYMTHTKSLHDLMAAHGDGNKPIWWTEFGWSTCKNGKTGTWDSCVSEAVQGDYFVRTLKMTKDNYPWVTNVFWFNSFDITTDSMSWNDNHGLLRYDLTPKASCGIISNYLTGHGC
jgi:hypothetical protein